MRDVKWSCKYGPPTLRPTDRRSRPRSRVTASRSLIFDRGIEDTCVRWNDERQAGRQRTSGGISECRHLVRAVWRKSVWGWFSDRAVRRGHGAREGRLCSASCIIHLHRSGLASAAPDPRLCPYLLQWLVERYIRPLTVTDILETLLSFPRFSFPRFTRLSLSWEIDWLIDRWSFI